MSKSKRPKVEAAPIRLDIGCGPNPREGFQGVDQFAFSDKVLKLNVVEPIYRPLPLKYKDLELCFQRVVTGYKPWPWKDQSVTEVVASHFAEHLTQPERCHFFNELYRVLKPNKKVNGQNVEGFATIIIPHGKSGRAYGDPTHQWPAFFDFCWYYLSRDWRAQNAPHTDKQHWLHGFNCDLECSWGYSLNPALAARNEEYRQAAAEKDWEGIQDMVCTLTRKA